MSALIKGKARDDKFVARVLINGEPWLIPLSRQEITFEQEIPLIYGENQISIIAEDLLGKKAEATIVLTSDTDGPQVTIDEVTPLGGTPPGIRVKGSCWDTSGVARFDLSLIHI